MIWNLFLWYKAVKMNSYSFEIETQRSPKEVFELLLEVKKWWWGIYDETIVGTSEKVNDEFSFSAGGGMHFSKLKMVELIPYEKIVWEVTESNLSFVSNSKEWERTRLVFDISEKPENRTKMTFTHEGLRPDIECYEQCTNAWSQYFKNLQSTLQ
jgi:hypothetical protein